MGIIYKITNTANEKVYIGQTVTTINKRWSGHRCDSKRKNTPLYSAMRKRMEDFSITVIEEVEDVNLDDREIYWISKYKSMHPNGYNISFGGQSYLTKEERLVMSERVKGEKNPMFGMTGESNPFYGMKHTTETKYILSEKAKGRVVDEDVKVRIGESTKIRHATIGHPFKGKSHTESAKKSISDKLKGRIFTEEHKAKIKANGTKRRSVDMLDLNDNYVMTFESVSEASDWLKENTNYTKGRHCDITTVCKGKRNKAYGYKWKYSESVETIESTL